MKVLALFVVCVGLVVCYNNGVGERPPMGWNTWYDFFFFLWGGGGGRGGGEKRLFKST